MKVKLIGIIPLFVILSSSVFSQKEKLSNKISIDEARRVFVGKSVRIFSEVESDGKLSSWTYADKKDGTYKRRPHYSVLNRNKYESTYLPIDYRWKNAVIVAIELDEQSIPKTNALGEILDGEKSSPTWVYVFVKFSDGTLASGLNRLETLFGEKNYIGVEMRLNPEFGGWKTFMSMDELAQRSKIINSKISSIIGKEVFATAQSKLYLPSSTLIELIDNKTRINDFPYLEPLTITTAKYNEEADTIILKLKDKSGKQYLTFSNYIPQKNIQGFFETIINNNTFIHPALRAEITKYNENEVTAIKSRTVFVGMQAGKVYDALGSPEKYEDSSEKNIDVMIYSNGRLRVYTNKVTRKVVDIQDNR